ncbi:MAG: hypothetical protein OXG88_08755 [Gammaproteobacteria bacterium]|nr:hypothetical protein [Gammaproteobacteria bacterium]
MNSYNYLNLNGNSGVDAYEIGDEFIRVQFTSGAIYLYTYVSAGADNIEHMKILAQDGAGLNAFINTTVQNGYEIREN